MEDDIDVVAERPRDSASSPEDAAVFSPENIARSRAEVRAHLAATKNPETIPGLDTGPAPKGIGFKILARTERPLGAAPKLFDCPFCNHPDKFYDGRVLLCADGKLRLIGCHCAATHVGGEAIWQREEVEALDRARREELADIATSLFPAASHLLAETQSILKRPASAEEAHSFPAELRRKLPKLHAAIAAAVFHREALVVVRMVPDRAAMERQPDDQKDKVKLKPLQFELHTVRGGAALLDSTKPPMQNLRAAEKALRNACELAAEDDWVALSDRSFAARARRYGKLCRDAIETLDDAVATMRAIANFAARANMGGICGWANDRDNPRFAGTRFSPCQSGIVAEQGDGKVVEVRLSGTYSVPDLPSLEQLRDALDKKGL